MKELYEDMKEEYSQKELETPKVQVSLEDAMKDLGMSNVRTKRLRKMSIDFLSWDRKDATDLYGIGKYGSDSYRIFYKNEIPENVQDKELKRYLNG